MDSNTADTHEDALKAIIEKQLVETFDYENTGYFKRCKQIDPVKENGLINWAEYNLFDAYAKEIERRAKQEKPPAVPNEEMPILDHQVLRNLYFGMYPGSTKAKNSIRRMVKNYKEKHHAEETPLNCNRFSDIVEQKKVDLEIKTNQKFRVALANISYE